MKLATIANPRARQEELGQFLTASPVADFMASMFGPLPRTVRLLDAGAGAGALTSAFVSRCCEKHDGVRAIEVTLYELDGEILEALAATMRDCEHRCSDAGVRFTFTIHSADFTQEMSSRLAGDLFGSLPPGAPLRKRYSPLQRRWSGSGVRQTQLWQQWTDRRPAGHEQPIAGTFH